ncbi:MAG: hypothetical protein IT507_13365 [Burkholderiaceae bacterium]|nr:hypothetical protein [Burkholderiaceae bacterium]
MNIVNIVKNLLSTRLLNKEMRKLPAVWRTGILAFLLSVLQSPACLAELAVQPASAQVGQDAKALPMAESTPRSGSVQPGQDTKAQPAAVQAPRNEKTVVTLLSGQVPATGLPESLADNPQWPNFVKTISASWDKYVRNISEPMMRWAQIEVPQHNKTVFYPFSGPDFATVYQMFPQAQRYVMVARQNAAMPLDLGSLTPTNTTNSLKLLTSAWQQFGSDGFFVTEYLDKYYHSSQPRIGASTFIATFLTLHGFEVNRISPIGVDENGNIHELPAEAKVWSSIRFHASKEGRQIIVDYLKIDLSNEGLESKPENRKFVENMANNPVLFKAASHLPQYASFDDITQAVLHFSPLIVQDETALAYSKLIQAHDVKLFGKFVTPHRAFQNTQTSLAQAYANRDDIRQLDFRFGYFKGGNYSLMVATRR